MAAAPSARRRFLQQLAGAAVLPFAAPPVLAEVPEALAPLIAELTGGAPLRQGRVQLDLPQLADNGNAVPLTLRVDSPMSDSDHVAAIHLFAEKNPRPVVARFHLGPQAGRAEIATRIRLAGTQHVLAVARMSDGSFWSAAAEVVVTQGACLDGT